MISYVISESGCAVGYIQAWQGADRCGLDMFLAAHAQGRSIGPRAARALALALSSRGWSPWTVDPAVDNTRAVRAWNAAGFAATGEVGLDDGRPTQVMVFGATPSTPGSADSGDR